MVVQLDQVVPFGRTFDEYTKIFNLSDADFQKKILGVGDGPASFNAEASKKGLKVTSIDPIYQFTKTEIKQRFDEVVDNIINQVRNTPDDWVWSYHQSPEDLKNNRLKALNMFLEDYEQGKQEQRYLIQEVPHLAFQENEFDLALCSHFLFLYSDQLSYEFHLKSLDDILKVSKEVRIFPLLTMMLDLSPYLDAIIKEFTDKGYQIYLEKVQYELQKGGNEMLVIKKIG
ncbi:SAM-dependent methyltransferase [Aphanothece hegewaldii CCALA 016]|uniref:SAM-dependent methyltransferase n=1 Tax=Aphanothece hegewaldii CCALA 016 TaxID=2107694 RepID=A0A2T1LWE6_9CHRO|nr:SAM-dependent methyltransferase [Aphanothece hegewaldii]PSF36128.1 SAM-dependent methyltransferase [Aphanothece hegewaldii CCALA 016]